MAKLEVSYQRICPTLPRKKISFLVTPLTNPEISNTPPPNDLFIPQKLSHLFEGPFFNENISLNVLY